MWKSCKKPFQSINLSSVGNNENNSLSTRIVSNPIRIYLVFTVLIYYQDLLQPEVTRRMIVFSTNQINSSWLPREGGCIPIDPWSRSSSCSCGWRWSGSIIRSRSFKPSGGEEENFQNKSKLQREQRVNFLEPPNSCGCSLRCYF